MVEPLEPRKYLAMFANGIDSDNLGEGVWAWGLRSTMSNLGFGSNYSAFFNYVKNTQGADYIIIKAAQSGSVYTNIVQNYSTTVRNAAHAAGLKLFPYFYIKGTDDATVTAEINVFNSMISSIGADGVVFDIEGDWAPGATAAVRDARIVNYFNGIGKSQAGDGSGSRDNMFMAYSSFPYVSGHPEVPWRKLGDYTDASMPQAYWAVLGNTPTWSVATNKGPLTGPGGPTRMVSNVNDEYKFRSTGVFNNTAYIKPVIMTGQMYGSATASEIAEFNNAVKASTTAVGNANVAGYRYKSVNWFDEGTAGVTTQAQRDALNTLDIGDLPGVPSSPSPANGASGVNGSGLVLNWADVVNTYGTPSTGAATRYAVFLDSVMSPDVEGLTTSEWTVPFQLSPGEHQWKVVAENIKGVSSSAIWTFTVPQPFAWMSGSTLNVQFDGSVLPISLSTTGSGNVSASRNDETLPFSGVTDILVHGSPNADALVLNAPATPPPITFNNGNGFDSFTLAGGTHTFTADLTNGGLNNVEVIVQASANAIFGSVQHLRRLTLNGGDAVANDVLVVQELAINDGALDLKDNDLIVDYSAISPIGTWDGSGYTGVTRLVADGRNGGSWNGASGILSSDAAAGPFNRYTLGVAEASGVLGISATQTSTFSGQTVDGSSVLVKFTYGGDANLSGRINVDDYGRIDANVSQNGSVFGFLNGDFNYDGKINVDDYGLIDGNINTQGEAL